jgi:CheY-like chemotaxis protein
VQEPQGKPFELEFLGVVLRSVFGYYMMQMTNKCVLQVEDEEADIFLLRHVFKQAGIVGQLRVVTDGQMAIDYLAGTGVYANREEYPLPCLVLLDLKLPRKSGLEVLEWIRQQPGLRSLVVVPFSASSLSADVTRAYELGANSYIQKPSDLQRTLEIAQLLKGWWLGYNQFAPIQESQNRG